MSIHGEDGNCLRFVLFRPNSINGPRDLGLLLAPGKQSYVETYGICEYIAY